ncbi:hypothetical protein VHUM_01772 [Vanrija humicola]|uniref:Mmc1 C-terminal domain-containing protein n=1 Tax=Vanrija humicola TaxID=5417 RepID=A0A7D8Z481_VANHU|nr:hypothetical protein VHUM_01772 [Vanrija humicola]
MRSRAGTGVLRLAAGGLRPPRVAARAPAIRTLSTRPTSRTAPTPPAPRPRSFAAVAAAPSPRSDLPPPPLRAPKSAPTPISGAERTRAVLSDIAAILHNDIGGSGAWLARVEAALSDLGDARRGRIAVVGDTLAGPRDVVSAVLEEPLSDSAGTMRAIQERYLGTGDDTLAITFAQGGAARTPGQLTVPSSFLSQSGADVIEVRPGPDAAADAIAADAVVLVLDPIRLTSAPALKDVLAPALAKGNVHFVVNGTLPPNATEDTVRAALAEQLKHTTVPGTPKPAYDLSFVNAAAALRAASALSAALSAEGAESGSKAKAFAAFQRDFVASAIGPLRGTLLTATPPGYQLRTADNTAAQAIAYTESVLASDRNVLLSASDVVADLRAEATSGAGKARRLSVVTKGVSSGVVEGSIDSSVAQAKKDIAALFDGRLSWLGLVVRLRVDDVGADIGSYISREFCADTQRQLVYEAGQLSELQGSLGASADRTARQLSASRTPHGGEANVAGHPFSSPLLLNHLSSLGLEVPPVGPRALLPPLTSRRAQLLSTVVPRLQVSAQRSLLTTYALALAGVSASWVACVPPLALISGYTATGLGLLSVVGGLALGQRFWARAQRRFWKDWARVTDMLKDDLVAHYDKTVQTLVLARPEVAADGLQELVGKRESRLKELEGRLERLRERLAVSGQ